MNQPVALNVSEILDRMKVVTDIATDANLAAHLGVSNKTVSSWRTRNSIPIEAVLQISQEANCKIDYLLFGKERTPLKGKEIVELFKFEDLRIKDFEIAGESVFVSLLGEFADEALGFMDEEEISENGKRLGSSILSTLAFIRHERRALLDSGKMDEAAFDDYARKAFRIDLPYFFRAIENKQKKSKTEGPQ